MDKKTKQLIIGGIILAIVIAIVSGFLASTDPDGLEKAMEDILPEELLHEIEESHLIESPMPDYEIESIEDGSISASISIIIGVIVTFLFVYVLGYLLKKRKNK